MFRAFPTLMSSDIENNFIVLSADTDDSLERSVIELNILLESLRLMLLFMLCESI